MPPTLSGISQAKHDQFMNEAAAALNGPALAEIHELENAQSKSQNHAINEGSEEMRREAIEVDSGFADNDRFEARAKEAAALEEPVWLKTFNENGIDVLRFHDWDEKTQSGGWRIPTSSQIESGLIAESHDQYLRLKTAPPVGRIWHRCRRSSGAGAVCE